MKIDRTRFLALTGTLSAVVLVTVPSNAECFGDRSWEPDCSHSSCPAECATIKKRFKRGVANQVIGCMEHYPSCESNTSCIIERGTDDPKKHQTICADPTATTFCRPLVDACKKNAAKEMTMESCVAMAKILTPAGRTELASCVTKGKPGQCVAGSSSCLDAMRE